VTEHSSHRQSVAPQVQPNCQLKVKCPPLGHALERNKRILCLQCCDRPHQVALTESTRSGDSPKISGSCSDIFTARVQSSRDDGCCGEQQKDLQHGFMNLAIVCYSCCSMRMRGRKRGRRIDAEGCRRPCFPGCLRISACPACQVRPDPAPLVDKKSKRTYAFHAFSGEFHPFTSVGPRR